MKRLAVAVFTLAMFIVGAIGCHTSGPTIVQTAHMITHPAAHKGDTIAFEIPQGLTSQKMYVHFPYGSPCEAIDLPVSPGEKPQCKVDKDVTDDPIRYPFFIDDKATLSPRAQLRCQECCHLCQVVITNPGAPLPQLPPPPSTFIASRQNDALEILIDSDSNNLPAAAPQSAYTDQQVTWFTPGTSAATWSVQFLTSKQVCQGSNKIVSTKGHFAYCNVVAHPGDPAYPYVITVTKSDGTVLTGTTKNGLSVVAPPGPPPTTSSTIAR